MKAVSTLQMKGFFEEYSLLRDTLVPLLLGQPQVHKFKRDFAKFLQTARASGCGKTEKQQHSPEVTAALELGGNLQ